MPVKKHYLMPERYSDQFSRVAGENGRSISLEAFAIAIDTDEIPTFPDYDTFNAAWEGAWQVFFDEHEGKSISQRQVFAYCQRLTTLFGIDS